MDLFPICYYLSLNELWMRFDPETMSTEVRRTMSISKRLISSSAKASLISRNKRKNCRLRIFRDHGRDEARTRWPCLHSATELPWWLTLKKASSISSQRRSEANPWTPWWTRRTRGRGRERPRSSLVDAWGPKAQAPKPYPVHKLNSLIQIAV